MEQAMKEAMAPKRLKTGSGKKPLIITGIILAVLVAAYIGLCAYAVNRPQIWSNTVVLGQDLSGQTVDEAAQTLEAALADMEIGIYLYPDSEEAPPQRADTPDAVVPVADLGVDVDLRALAQDAYAFPLRGTSFFSAGWRFLTHSGVFYGASSSLSVDDTKTQRVADDLAQTLSQEPLDASYTLTEDSLQIQVPKDGRQVDSADLFQALSSPYWDVDLSLDISYQVLPAQTLTVQEIYDETSGEVKNATYDAATDSIVPEQMGADFDTSVAQAALDAAAPGDTITIPAQVELPTVTAEDLETLLFRDVLGQAQTKVGGTSARKSNVQLSAAAINEYVLNAGEVFSYNEAVGQRTAARGYKPAPAYVQGETVDEIGGGICQTSSTLYLACLRSNLEITERYAHRYIPSYIPAGMDATVSWGGPDYKFTNNTDYPIKIVTTYANSTLTVKILGTNIDGTYTKITNEYLSTTPYEVVYEDDPTLAPGTEKVKTTPYTGYKYKTYRHVYAADGTLISSEYEATSDYKSRNKVILRGPALPDTSTTTPGTGSTDPGTGTTSPGTNTDPGTTTDPGTGTTTDPGTNTDSNPIIVVEPNPNTPDTGENSSGLPSDVRPEDEPFL